MTNVAKMNGCRQDLMLVRSGCFFGTGTILKTTGEGKGFKGTSMEAPCGKVYRKY